MQDQLQQLQAVGLEALASVTSIDLLESWRIEYLSRQGSLPILLEQMKNVPKEDRPIIGKLANQVKTVMQEAFDAKKGELEVAPQAAVEDPTLPGRAPSLATKHVLTQTLDRIISIFQRMGFALAEGPDIETEFYNFDALNTPSDHPARNEQDTFYVNLSAHVKQGRKLLRTQTSPVQIRVMEQEKPPIRIIAPGRCYRRDEMDATHGVFFHQIEGLYVAEGVALSDLKGTMEYFFREFLGPETKVRFRPHFFPFTEPSFEMDLSRAGMKVRGREWLEICGCGMVDPAVLEAAGLDPERYTGFAFGMGVERMAMMVHEIPDLRFMFENDFRFLKQF